MHIVVELTSVPANIFKQLINISISDDYLDWIIVSNYWDTKHMYTIQSIIGDGIYFHCKAVCVHACYAVSVIAQGHYISLQI